ncbi:PREDICTED: dynactin subunit 1 [Rhagoletis zephyria]|uniref:dynactin subunit 1 n=1 Tax=Rhagoletis zephyria TaxID=28612 RepID=UPI000811285C|nr:PREDICTED: dynactin subunit 1 [Rhagoletis zephyria]XP_017488857.1 PREDICTED: dynactin subunit 1 [Rhagoletis zephyria]XP_017488858.1 PREDICTED: dynactin subunit 1 [Rhagoletis zephyria]
MSERSLKVGARVDITGKDLQGTVAYVGMTSFAVGKWVGVVLDEPKGKNNGTIKGQTYFECGENFGTFVRPTQLRVIGGSPDSKKSSEDIADSASSSSSIARTPIAQPTKARLSGSRSSLSSSRQSLLGSRSHLSPSLIERSGSTASSSSGGRKSLQPPSITARDHITAGSATASSSSIPTAEGGSSSASGGNGSASHSTSKRASFVETGFLEILRPQFTPLQPMRSPSFTAAPPGPTAEEKAAAAEQQKLIEDLQGKVTDLTEKLETLKQRRNEDKERLREFDKMKIQFEQLQEFRSKIMAAQASLQKELQRAKQEAKDAIEARERHAQEMSELSDNVELITLDKEMAEEKADTLQLELDSAKERIEELQVDLELLRSEMQNKAETSIGEISGEGGVGGMSTYEFKQLEQQNLRLKETLVRLRDLSAHDKHDIQKLTKELELKKSEVAELERTKEKLSSKIDDLEATVADLQEQVDAALGAEEMVEQLAEKKMELEDKVKMLEEEVAQLEALEEVHEQLVESNHELEMDLREELDLMSAARKEALRERDAAIETIYDRDQTINKFRELVQKLNEQLLDLRDRTTNNDPKSLQDSNSGVKIASETIDYKQMFAESKAYTRAIDVQLRQIELTQANEHVQMLTAFMPESFMSRGGDHDSILVILLISRIVFKCGIVVSQTRERFPAVNNVTREAVFQGHSVQQFAFKCRLMHYIHNLQCALHQILYGLNSCQPDTLLRAGNSLPEMVAQEKTIDGIIELLKSNQLDENSTTENIEKCMAFFNAMNSVLLAGEDLVNETQMIRDCVAALGSACESILNDVTIARAIVREGGETSDSMLLMQYLNEQTEAVKQQVKLIKRRLPQDQHVIKCGISPLKLEAMRQITQSLSRIMSVMHLATKQALQVIAASIESDNTAEHTVEHGKFWELLTQACERVYEQDDRGPSQNFKGLLSQANIDLQQLAQYLLDKEYEIMSLANQKQEKPVSPIISRAHLIKKQLEQKNVLSATLENREADIKQLKLAAKLKQNELSEMQIRKDLAEKKLSVLQSEYEHAVEKWKRQYEETHAQLEKLQKKEKEYEDTLDHLQSDIEALETEKSTLREKLKSSGGTKRFADSSLSTTGGSGAAYVSHGVSGSTPLIAEELQLLKTVLHNERNARLRMQAQQIRDKLKKFEPIHVPQPKDKRITELESELTRMKHAWALSLLQAGPKPDSTGIESIVALQRRNQQVPAKAEISSRASHLAAEILTEYLQRNPHRAANCEFAAFPTVEVKRVLKV